MKLGSLFDGSGTCPLAAVACGIEPVWASEVEAFPIAVTKSRFPNMKHLGDITKINGAEIEPVDVITFGSPCQNFSVAGNGKGLEGEQSSLFLEAIRVIREMRSATNGVYPRIILWENVPGAFSTNKGEDFRRVLEEFLSLTGEHYSVPRPEKRWNKAGYILGDNFSLAWRQLDSQYWGVAQRRKRVFLILDFGGRAVEILFKREGLQRDFKTCRRTRETPSQPAEDSSQQYDRIYAIENHPNDSRVRISDDNTVQALTSRMGTGGGNTPIVIAGNIIGRQPEWGGNGNGFQEGISYTLTAMDIHAVTAPIGVMVLNDQGGDQMSVTQNVIATLRAQDHGHPSSVVLPYYHSSKTSFFTLFSNGAKIGALVATDYKDAPCVSIPYTLKIRCGSEGGAKEL